MKVEIYLTQLLVSVKLAQDISPEMCLKSKTFHLKIFVERLYSCVARWELLVTKLSPW